MSVLRIYASLAETPTRCQWALVNDAQEPVSGEGPPTQLPRRAARVQLVIPAAQVLLARTRVPSAARLRAGAMLAFAVEEQIVDEPDASQVSWLGAAGEDDIVAVIDKAGLERWRGALAAVGLSTRLSDARRTGPRPLLLGAATWIGVAGSSLLLQRLTGNW